MDSPNVQVKDLRSTGYFFDELKSYSKTSEIDLATYCVEFAIPYLAKVSEKYDRSGQPDRSKLLRLAAEHLFSQRDIGLTRSLFILKKIAELETARTGKAVLEEHLSKSDSVINRQRSESAELILKLLVNIIKMFRLPDPNAGLRKTDDARDAFAATIVQMWGAFETESLEVRTHKSIEEAKLGG